MGKRKKMKIVYREPSVKITESIQDEAPGTYTFKYHRPRSIKDIDPSILKHDILKYSNSDIVWDDTINAIYEEVKATARRGPPYPEFDLAPYAVQPEPRAGDAVDKHRITVTPLCDLSAAEQLAEMLFVYDSLMYSKYYVEGQFARLTRVVCSHCHSGITCEPDKSGRSFKARMQIFYDEHIAPGDCYTSLGGSVRTIDREYREHKEAEKTAYGASLFKKCYTDRTTKDINLKEAACSFANQSTTQSKKN